MEAVMEAVDTHQIALDEIERFIHLMKQKYPQHRLSVGYMGNLDRFGNDDRTFKVFTCYSGTGGRATTESYWLGAFDHLKFDPSVELRIRQWIESLDRKVAKGLLVSLV